MRRRLWLPLLFVVSAVAGCVSTNGEETRLGEESAAALTTQATPSQGQIAAAAGKRALVIALGDYPEPNVNGYRRINSANDVPLVEAALRAQGFVTIRTLGKDEGDRAGVLGALDDLIGASRPDDVVVVHYSGHGDQVPDDNGDEIDGYDEVLVPYGAPSNEFFKTRYAASWAERAAAYASDRAGFKHIRDDELQDKLTRLRERVGPRGNVVFWIDACHSGTGTRGGDGPMPRGPDEPIGLPAGGARSGGGTADEAGLFEGARGNERAGLAPYVVFSASRQGEKDWETRDEDGTPVGPLSLALSRAVPATRSEDSYQALFDRVAALMSTLAPRQVPQLEGDASTQVFSGRAVPYEPSYRVTEITNDGHAILAGGRITGLMKGSRVAFYRIGDAPAASNRPLALGSVVGTSAVEARVVVDRDTPRTVDLKQSRAFVTEAAFGDLTIDVHLGSGLAPGDRSAIAAALKPNGLARIVDNPSRALLAVDRTNTVGADASAFEVMTSVDRAVVGEPIKASASSPEAIRARVEDYARNRYLKAITLSSSEVDVRVNVVPARLRQIEDEVRGNSTVCEAQSDGGSSGVVRLANAQRTWQLVDQATFFFEIGNVGTKAAHVAILELYPDGRIDQVFPPRAYSTVDVRIEPGKTVQLRDACRRASQPYGVYVFKLFATVASASPIDFRPILTQEPVSRAALSPFERMLQSTYGTTRSNETTTIPIGGGSTDQIQVKVVAR